MKVSNEVRVGILALVSISLLIFGYNYLKGKNLLSNDVRIIARYDNLGGLQASAPVRIKGLQIGTVTDVYQEVVEGRNTGKLIAVLDIQRSAKIPRNAIPQIVNASMMAGAEVEMYFEGTCSDGDCLENGAVLEGSFGGGFFGSMFKQATPMLADAEVKMSHLIDHSIHKFDSLMAGTMAGASPNGINKTVAELRGTVSNIHAMTAGLNKAVNANTAAINATMSNLESITKNLKENNQRISNILANVEGITRKLNEETMGKVNTTLDGVNTTLTNLKTTMRGVDEALANVTTLIKNINSGNGVLAKLINDPAMASQLALTISDIQLLVQDLRLNHKRYTGIFKKAKAYTLPQDDPAHK